MRLDVIPTGPYCYTPEESPCEENNWVYKIKCCPYFRHDKDQGVGIVCCRYLGESGLENISDTEFETLERKYGSSDAVFEAHPLDLLWDQIKSCGINDKI